MNKYQLSFVVICLVAALLPINCIPQPDLQGSNADLSHINSTSGGTTKSDPPITTKTPTTKPTTTPASTTSSPTTSSPTTTPASTTSSPTPSTLPPPSSSSSPSTTTAAPSTTPAPSKHDRSFDIPSFIGGMILALGLIAIGYVVFKFYKTRTDPNYRTI